MQTQCPKCKTVFRFNARQLDAADGLVCCGQCQQIFKATSYPSGAPFHGDLFAEEENSELEGTHDPSTDNNDPKALRRLLLSQNNSPAQNTVLWAGGTIALLLLALVQLTYNERDRLIRYPELKPIIEKTCGYIPGCQLSPKRDLSKLELLSRNVYTHPNIKDALMISAVLTNSATFTQAYPILLITMSNTRGKIVAQRYFSPEEYLNAEVNIKTGMQIGVPIAINLEILDPGNDALAFELDFL